jgi:hypothetical protein
MQKGFYGALAGFLVLALGAGCASKTGSSAFSTQKWLEARWIMEVSTLAKVGDSKLQVVRWTRPVVIEAENGSPEQMEALEQAVAEIRLALEGVHTITLAAKGTDLAKTASMHVRFAESSDWETAAKGWGLNIGRQPSGLDGAQFIRWNSRMEIEEGYMLIGNKLTPDELRHTTLEKLYQTFGVRNDSGFFPDSIVYESGGDTGGLTRLSERDKKLLRFLYEHVPTGTRPDVLARLIDAHWVYGVK